MLISVIIPVYRNSGSILPTCRAISRQLEANGYAGYEIILVNDGSDDASGEEINAAVKENPGIKAVSLPENRGQVNAIRKGFIACVGEAGIVISADGQDPATLIPAMVAAWQKGASLVIAARSSRDEGLLRRFSSSFFYRFIRLFIPGIPSGGFDCFLLDRNLVPRFTGDISERPFLQGVLLRLNPKPSVIHYHRNRRIHGHSQWTARKKLQYVITAITFVAKKS